MHRLAGAAVGAAILAATAGLAATTAFADTPEQDQLAVVAQSEQIDQQMADLPGVFVSGPPEGVLGVSVRRDNLPENTELDMLRLVGERVDMDRGLAATPH